MAWSAGQILTAAQLNTYIPQEKTTWTPTWTNVTVGSGTVTANYVRISETVTFNLKFVLGAGSAISGDITFTLPLGSSVESEFDAKIVDVSASATYSARGMQSGAGNGCQVRRLDASGTNLAPAVCSSTTPMTWATGDYFIVTGTYTI